MSTPTPAAPTQLVPASVPMPLPPPPQLTGQPAAPTTTLTNSPRVYNAIYSSVQVYECMVRGIAVMRRRLDSYVNATQILKVAGIDKGRRTKILEKEILPGRHEIVQGGYGKYQGTWIPLERGREVATQFGVLPLLAPLFDYVPTTNTLGTLPTIRTPHALFTFPHGTSFSPYTLAPGQGLPIPYPPPPGTALNVLQHGRSAGLFTPTSTFGPLPPGFQFTGMGYQIPHQSLSAQSSAASIISATPVHIQAPRVQAPEPPVTRTQSTPAPENRATPAPSESLVGQKRPRQDDETATAAGSPVIETADGEVIASAAPLMASDTIITDAEEARVSKRPRLNTSSQNVPGTLSSEPTQLEETLMETQSTSANGSTSAKGTTVSRVATLPVVPPNTIVPPALAPPTRPLTDLPEAKSRIATKPLQSRADRQLPAKSAQCRAILVAILNDEEPASILDQLAAASPADGQVDVDLVIDEQGHTALHYAASMARVTIVEQLISSGADVHRGNYDGETPLIRTVLSTEPHATHTFSEILTALQPSLRTVDNKSQSVLHHISHVAGVKGRAATARYYMETVLERVVRHREELGGTAELVDLQDVHGDTALNISARVGNRALVRMLIDIGANRILGNKLGLRPGDFGVEGENLKAPYAEDYVLALRKGPSPPVQKSQDVIADLTAMVQQLSSDFTAEIKVKQDNLDKTQAQLRAATRELAEKRRQIQQWQSSLTHLDQVRQRIRNVERVLKDEDSFDWTGRTNADGKPADVAVAGKAFEHRGAASTLAGLGKGGANQLAILSSLDPDPAFPATTGTGTLQQDAIAALIRLKRMKMWHERVEKLMQQRIDGTKGASAEKELQCRKVVALCTGVPNDQVDTMLENLVIAMESDGQVVDLGRVAGFMQKVGTNNNTQ